MKKYVIVLIALALLLAVSCASGEIEESFSGDFMSGIEGLDCDGMTAKIYYSQSTTSDIFMGYPEDSFFHELVKDRFSDIEKQINIHLDYTIGPDSAESIIQRDAFAGTSDYAISIGQCSQLYGATRGGMVTDLTDYTEYIDYTDTAKYGSREYLKGSLWNGGLYAVIPNYWPIVPYSALMGLMSVNEKLIKQIGVTDPREFCENRTWTWAKFEEEMPKWAHTNNASEYVYAFEATTHWLFTAMQASSGCGVCYYENGQYNLSSHTQTAIDAFNKGLDWAEGDFAQYVRVPGGNVWSVIREDFIADKAVSAIVSSNYVIQSSDSLVYEVEDFGLISFPRGPEAPEDQTGSCSWWVEGATAIPTLYSEPDISAVIINLMYEPLRDFETREKIDEYLRRYFLYDDRDIDVLNRYFATNQYNYRGEGLTDMIINITGSKTVQAWLDAYEDADETNRAKYLENMEETADLLYGKSYEMN